MIRVASESPSSVGDRESSRLTTGVPTESARGRNLPDPPGGPLIETALRSGMAETPQPLSPHPRSVVGEMIPTFCNGSMQGCVEWGRNHFPPHFGAPWRGGCANDSCRLGFSRLESRIGIEPPRMVATPQKSAGLFFQALRLFPRPLRPEPQSCCFVQPVATLHSVGTLLMGCQNQNRQRSSVR